MAQCSQFSNFWKNFFRKSTQKSKLSTFGVKTKVIRTEILHILVPMGSRGDPYLTVSRTFEFLSNSGSKDPWIQDPGSMDPWIQNLTKIQKFGKLSNKGPHGTPWVPKCAEFRCE